MKKGFTLIELLAVIVILSALIAIIGTSVTRIVKKSKDNIYSDVELKSIKKSAEMWGAYNMDKLPSNGSCIYITLSTLQDADLINSDIVDIRNTDNKINGLYIKISASDNNHIYEVLSTIPDCTLVS